MDLFRSFVKIEVPEPPSNHLQPFCRFCYSTTNLQSIFPTKDNGVQRIIDLLEQLAGIRLSAGEDSPSEICRQCRNTLEEFDHFRRKCKIYSDEIKRLQLEWIDNDESSITIKCEDFQWIEPSTIKCENVVAHVEDTVGKVVQQIEVTKQSRAENSSKKTEHKGCSANKGTNLSEVLRERKPKLKSSTASGRTGSLMAKLKRTTGWTGKITKRKLDRRDFRCKVCEQFFTDKEAINFHMKRHIDTVNFRCLNCQRPSETVQGLMTHAIQSYIMTSFPCRHCDIYFKSKEKLLAHELYCEKNQANYQVVSKPAKAMQCYLCRKSFDTAHALQGHMQTHDSKFGCSKCGANLPTAACLKNHEDRYHSQGAEELIASIVRCEPCQRNFVDGSAYRNHHTRFHELDGNLISRQLDKEKLYECDHCPKKFWSINTIRYHVLVHRQYRDCDQCSESFRSSQELREHKLLIHPVSCKFCPQKFFSRKACRSHCNRMHGMLQIKQKTTADSNALTYEWRKVVYRCACCEQEYEKFGQLEDHYARMHPGVKVLIRCTYCSKNSQSRIGYVGHLTKNCGQTPKRLSAWN